MKEGFTLIELLAVIVILAIIAVIAVPIILNIIEDTKINSVKTSANLYLKSTELSISTVQMNNEKIPSGTYPITKDGNICIGNIEESNCNGKTIKIEVKGNKPKSGEIIINEKGNIKINRLEINDYIYYRDNNEYIVEKISKHTIISDNGLITFDSINGTLSNYKIYGNTKKINGFKNIADPQQIEKFVAGMQALGTTNHGNQVQIITDENGRKVLTLCSYSGHGHDNYAELKKIFSGIFKENTQYTISFDYYNNTTSKAVNMAIKYTDGRHEQLDNFKISTAEAENGKVYSFEHTTLANKTVSSIDLEFRTGVTYIYLDTLQIEEGTSATKYVPYGYFDYPSVGNFITDKADKNYGKYEIPVKVTGKNLFNENHLLENSSVAKVDNGYSVSAYPSQYSFSSKLYKNIKSVLKSDVSYTLSRKVSNYVGASSGSINLRTSDLTLVFTYESNGIKSKTFTLNNSQISNFSTIWIYGRGDNPTIFEYIQLEIGDNATEYEPYKEENYSIYLDEPLRCIDDVCDYIDYKRGMVVRHIEQIDDSGDKELEGSFRILAKPKYETISLPKLNTNEGITNIFINTYIKPSNVIVSSN